MAELNLKIYDPFAKKRIRALETGGFDILNIKVANLSTCNYWPKQGRFALHVNRKRSEARLLPV